MKTIYTQLIKQLQTKVPALRWIDLNRGQLDVPYTDNQRPPVSYPCVLIDISVERTTAFTDTLQESKQPSRLSLQTTTPVVPVPTPSQHQPSSSTSWLPISTLLYKATQAKPPRPFLSVSERCSSNGSR